MHVFCATVAACTKGRGRVCRVVRERNLILLEDISPYKLSSVSVQSQGGSLGRTEAAFHEYSWLEYETTHQVVCQNEHGSLCE